MGFVLRTIGFCSRFSKYFLLFRADGLILFGAGGGQNSPIRGQSGLFPKAGRGTNQKGAQEGPERELKQEEPEQVMAGTEGRRNRKKKRRRRGRSREGNVAGGKAMRGEDAEAGKGDAEGSEQGRRCGRKRAWKGRDRKREEASIRKRSGTSAWGSYAPQGDAGSAI